MIVRRGTTLGLNWYVVMTEIGTKCAYVAMTDDQARHVFGKHLEEDDYEAVNRSGLPIHGSCTYLKHGLFKQCDFDTASSMLKLSSVSLKHYAAPYVEKESWCIGWDYGHFNDVITSYQAGLLFMISVASDDDIINDISKVISAIVNAAASTSVEDKSCHQ